MSVLLGAKLVLLIFMFFVCEVCVKMCDFVKGVVGQRIIVVFLFCFLDKGMMSFVIEVRVFRCELVDEMNVLDLFSFQLFCRKGVFLNVRFLKVQKKEENLMRYFKSIYGKL